MPEHTAFVQKELPANANGCHHLLAESAGNMVFCPPQFPLLPELIAAARLRHAPVVVVAENPTETEWLDVLDAGACDYIAPPFDSVQMRWLLDVCLSRPAGDEPPLRVQASSASC
jgi:DNA-binding NtrC family response regulator